MAKSYSVGLFLLVLFFFASRVSSDSTEKCNPINKCRCLFENGTGIDLNNSAKDYFYKASLVDSLPDGGFVLTYYYFHPCADLVFTPEAQDKVPNGCGKVSICQRYIEFGKPINNTYTPTTSINFTSSGNVGQSQIENIDQHFHLVYKYEASTVTVKLICVNDDSEQFIISNRDPKDRLLTFYSRDACVRELEPAHHRSLGTTLLIIFFVLLIVYLILGCCTKKFLMGAQGVEVIPNLTFWTEFPGLVKDGVQFVKNGFKVTPVGVSAPGQSPNPHSYDSI